LFLSTAELIVRIAGPEGGEEPKLGKALRLISDPFEEPEFAKNAAGLSS